LKFGRGSQKRGDKKNGNEIKILKKSGTGKKGEKEKNFDLAC